MELVSNLAVGVPSLGVPTETFIHRYCSELSTASAHVIAQRRHPGGWTVDAPTLILNETLAAPQIWKLWRGLSKLRGVQSPFGDFFNRKQIEGFIRKHQIETVFSQYLVFAWWIHPLCQSLGLRHVVRGHGFDLSELLNDPLWQERYQALSAATAIVVPSGYQVDRLRSIGLPAGKLHAAFCGVSIPSQVPPKLHTESVTLLAVGRLTPKKAPLLLLKAFFQAAAHNPHIRLILIGGGVLSDSVRDMIAASPYQDRVDWPGPQPHAVVLQKYAQADIFVQHSVTDPQSGDQEGAPVSIMEAMAHAIPVISTRHSGIPYQVDEGLNGLLVDENDADGMAEAIIRLSADRNLRERMGQAARQKAIQAFSWEAERRSLLALLKAES